LKIAGSDITTKQLENPNLRRDRFSFFECTIIPTKSSI
jgi:hypothetical protein